MLGKQMVREAAKRSSQRHKCSQCGGIAEVCVAHIIDDPRALLSQAGRERLFDDADGPSQGLQTPPPVDEDKAASCSASDEEMSKRIEDAITAEMEACEDRAEPQAPLPASSEEAGEARNEVSKSSTPPIVEAVISPFTCTICKEGRLGVHCFPGDATNGNKRELMDKLFALFDAMPELIALKLPPSKVKTITEEDIFWVD